MKPGLMVSRKDLEDLSLFDLWIVLWRIRLRSFFSLSEQRQRPMRAHWVKGK